MMTDERCRGLQHQEATVLLNPGFDGFQLAAAELCRRSRYSP
jgi:hypothetical protein